MVPQEAPDIPGYPQARVHNARRNARGRASEPSRRQAAMYVRMSTDHQQYSTVNQKGALQLRPRR